MCAKYYRVVQSLLKVIERAVERPGDQARSCPHLPRVTLPETLLQALGYIHEL